MSDSRLWKRIVDRCLPPVVVAEIAQAHEGSLGLAHSYLETAAEAGADAVKYQVHFAGEESTLREPWRIPFSYEDKSRYDYWKRMEFCASHWEELRKHAGELGLFFIGSPFSFRAVELLEAIDSDLLKVASGEVSNFPLLRRIAASRRSVLLSSGLSDWKELDRAVAIFRKAKAPLCILQCTTSYPTRMEEIGLNLIEEMEERYDLPAGLSDHSGSIFPSLAAAVRGARVLEIHLTYSRAMFGPDAAASLEPEELNRLVEGVKAVHTMNTHPLQKEAVGGDRALLRATFGRSVVAARDLPAGTLLQCGDLALKKPGEGSPPEDLELMLGRRLTQAVGVDDCVRWEHLEEGRPPKWKPE